MMGLGFRVLVSACQAAAQVLAWSASSKQKQDTLSCTAMQPCCVVGAITTESLLFQDVMICAFWRAWEYGEQRGAASLLLTARAKQNLHFACATAVPLRD